VIGVTAAGAGAPGSRRTNLAARSQERGQGGQRVQRADHVERVVQQQTVPGACLYQRAL
jgi:hypothetical protein